MKMPKNQAKISERNFFTRRGFLAAGSCLGAALALGRRWPLAALAEPLAQDPRVAPTPLADKGFAAVRKIGDGVYATIADFSKGLQTLSNGGFVIGRDAALLIEGHCTPAGAALEVETLRLVSQAPVRAAVDTHYHFDHSLGNTFYGAQGIPVWAHARTAPLMVERYANFQGKDKTAVFGPFEKRLREAADETRRKRAEGDSNAFKMMYSTVDAAVIALPNVSLDPAKLPLTVDLGGRTAVIEAYPGHSPTDLVVRVPEQNIVFTGDLLFNGWYPVTFDGQAGAWRRTLEKFAAFGKDALFVPGHGQVCGQEGIASQRAVFDDLAAHAAKMHKMGVPVEEAQHRYAVPERFKGFTVFAWAATIGPAISQLYEELKTGKS